MPRWFLRGKFSCRLPAVVFVLAAAVALPFAPAADWPQWRGPNRDDVSTETGLLKDWPQGGPPRVWLFEDCGVGYGGPAIVGDRVYTMGGRDGVELLLALDASTGKEVWHSEIGAIYTNDWGDGPRSTPTVDGDFIYALGAQGNLVCAKRASGEKVWSKSMQDIFCGKTPAWGYAESPLIDGDRVLCTPGGEKGAIIALDKSTGNLIWQSSDVTNNAGYSSIVSTTSDGQRGYVQLMPEKLIGLDSAGKLLWSEQFPGRVAVIPTPIVHEQFVYATAGYGAGCLMMEIGPDHSAKKVYANKTMKNHHGGVILLGDCIYGHSDDLGWVCQDLKSGEAKWRDKKALGKGAVAYAEGMLYCLAEDSGEVALVEASTEGWKEHGRFKLDPQTKIRKDKGKIWTHPVIAGGKLFLRDQNLVYCYDVRDAKLARKPQ